MASESRQLPRSNVKRNSALLNAKTKNDALGIASFLTTDTQTKLNYIQPLYKSAMDTLAVRRSIEMNSTIALNATGVLLKRMCSRFVQVFGLAVNDEVFTDADFAFYHIDSKGNVPVMNTDDEVKTVAENLVTGEAARVAAGGTPMSMPSIAEVIALQTTFLANLATHNIAISNMTTAEAAVNGYNTLVDEAILFVWNEVETHFSTLTNAVIRVQGRLWGIIYVRTGGNKTITGKVTDHTTGLPIEGVNVSFENGTNDAVTDASGNYEFTTTLMDVQKLLAEHLLYLGFSEDVTLLEGVNPVFNISMVLKP